MKNRPRIIMVILIIISFFSLVAFNRMMDGVYWHLMAEADSPDGRFTAFEYHYDSDSNRHAPYGTYVFLQPSEAVNKRIDGYLIFAGYCDNEKILSWVNNQQLDIACEHNKDNSIKTQSVKAYGIHINVLEVSE